MSGDRQEAAAAASLAEAVAALELRVAALERLAAGTGEGRGRLKGLDRARVSVAEAWGTSVAELAGPGQRAIVSRAREAFMLLATHCGGASTAEAASWIYMDHSSGSQARRRGEERLLGDAEFKARFAEATRLWRGAA